MQPYQYLTQAGNLLRKPVSRPTTVDLFGERTLRLAKLDDSISIIGIMGDDTLQKRRSICPATTSHRSHCRLVQCGQLFLQPRLYRRLMHLENHAIRGPHVEHWRSPFHRILQGQINRLAPLGNSRVHRVAIHDSGVELLGEDDSRLVANLKLHGHYGLHTGVNESLRYPGKLIIRANLGG